MNATYAQPMRMHYAEARVESSRNPIEQIHYLVNLLMIFSMLLSIMSPLYTPAINSAPSFAFPGEVRAGGAAA